MNKRPHNFKDLTNKRFGRLVVIEYSYTDNNCKAYWLCKCDCGNIIKVVTSNLKNGNTKSCGCFRKEIIGKINRNKIVSEETRQKISITRIKKNIGIGKDNPNWNPNLTNEDRQHTRRYPKYLEWRDSVYERDNYTCQVCGDDKGGNIVAHHFESYTSNKKLRTILSNGITMCEECHLNFHHQYGYGNNTKKQFEEFLIQNKTLG